MKNFNFIFIIQKSAVNYTLSKLEKSNFVYGDTDSIMFTFSPSKNIKYILEFRGTTEMVAGFIAGFLYKYENVRVDDLSKEDLSKYKLVEGATYGDNRVCISFEEGDSYTLDNVCEFMDGVELSKDIVLPGVDSDLSVNGIIQFTGVCGSSVPFDRFFESKEWLNYIACKDFQSRPKAVVIEK